MRTIIRQPVGKTGRSSRKQRSVLLIVCIFGSGASLGYIAYTDQRDRTHTLVCDHFSPNSCEYASVAITRMTNQQPDHGSAGDNPLISGAIMMQGSGTSMLSGAIDESPIYIWSIQNFLDDPLFASINRQDRDLIKTVINEENRETPASLEITIALDQIDTIVQSSSKRTPGTRQKIRDDIALILSSLGESGETIPINNNRTDTLTNNQTAGDLSQVAASGSLIDELLTTTGHNRYRSSTGDFAPYPFSSGAIQKIIRTTKYLTTQQRTPPGVLSEQQIRIVDSLLGTAPGEITEFLRKYRQGIYPEADKAFVNDLAILLVVIKP